MSFNTGNELGSLDERDLYDNAINLDKAMNSTEPTWRDRFNVEKPTIDAALKSAGFMPAGFDFVTGGTLQPGDRNKAVYNPAPNGDNNWYRWNGVFPKEIAVNSQPNPKDENNWVPVLINEDKVPVVPELGRKASGIKFIAHRGSSKCAPENTLPAYILAGEQGFWGAECDIQLTVDGTWVLMHDDTVDRTTNGSGKITAMTIAEVKELDAGIKFDLFYKDTEIPTLSEFLAVCQEHHLVPVIEIKSSISYNVNVLKGLIEECLLFFPDYGFIIICFNLNTLKQIRTFSKYTELQYVVDRATQGHVDSCISLTRCGIDFNNYDFDPMYALRNNVLMNSWTINDMATLKNRVAIGVNQITTDLISL